MNILIYSGNGYNFGEYIKPVLEELCPRASVYFLQGNYCLSPLTRQSLQEISELYPDFDFEVVPVYQRGNSVLKYHYAIQKILKRMEGCAMDLLVLNTDFTSFDQYLIQMARRKKIKVVLFHSNLLSPRIFKMAGVGPIRSPGQKSNAPVAQGSWVWRKWQGACRRADRYFLRVRYYYLCPWLLTGKSLNESIYDQFTFTAGRGDVVIGYDDMEMNALRKVVPLAQAPRVAHHPCVKYRRVDMGAHGRHKLLVLLSAYAIELPERQMAFWQETLAAVVKKADIHEVHLRFHPRTNPHLRWPLGLKNFIQSLGCRLEVIDSSTVSLPQTAGDYAGVVGAMSGAIRTARVVSDGFVIGLLNASGDETEEVWMMGHGEGIHWISPGEAVTEEHLKPFIWDMQSRPTVSNIIMELAGKQ